MYLVSSGFSFKPTSFSSSSSSTQFSQEWARRKLVVKHSIKNWRTIKIGPSIVDGWPVLGKWHQIMHTLKILHEIDGYHGNIFWIDGWHWLMTLSLAGRWIQRLKITVMLIDFHAIVRDPYKGGVGHVSREIKCKKTDQGYGKKNVGFVVTGNKRK